MLQCFSESGNATGSTVADLADSPCKVQFTNKANQEDASDDVFCHLYFTDSTLGNTVVWQFINNSTGSPVTWAAEGAASTSTTGTSAAIASSSTSSAGSSSSTSAATVASTTLPPSTSASLTSTAGPSSTGSKAHQGLSTGASAGIGVGVALGVLGALALGFTLLWRRRRRRRQNPEWHPAPQNPPEDQDYQDAPFDARAMRESKSPGMLGGPAVKASTDSPQELRGHETASELPT
ncbi:hypothetical protein LTR85_009954 [Meristemomyces frigidus]|nr:hypothetical protein LTR85_009954 [Meristemomyces frigidus]